MARAATEIPAPTDPREICIGAVTGAAGARVSAPLTIAAAGGVAAFQVDVTYDPTLLAPAGVRLGPDTVAAGGWFVDSQIQTSGSARVLGYSTPPRGLTTGLKTVAILDFDVTLSHAIAGVPFPLTNCVLGDANGLSMPCAFCLQPGIDGAVPRFALSLVDDGFSFTPAMIPIESGDWVLWRNGGTSRTHTTTSGDACVADGRWRGNLPPGGRFTRRFTEAPGQILDYFSEPDCVFGMAGEVDITSDIHLSVSDSPASALLSWTGGSGLYRVFRSDSASFVSPVNATFAPDGGDGGTSFSDPAPVAPGTVHFYLVQDKP
jgi:plastocyanin